MKPTCNVKHGALFEVDVKLKLDLFECIVSYALFLASSHLQSPQIFLSNQAHPAHLRLKGQNFQRYSLKRAVKHILPHLRHLKKTNMFLAFGDRRIGA